MKPIGLTENVLSMNNTLRENYYNNLISNKFYAYCLINKICNIVNGQLLILYLLEIYLNSKLNLTFLFT